MIGFLDCYSGISGDMLLGAIVDAGLPLSELERAIDGLSLAGYVRLEATEVMRAGLRATKVEVVARPDQPHRTFRAVAAIVDAASLPAGVRERSLAVLGRLAAVEGRIHGMATDDVELHEVGAIDSIVDVVACVAGLEMLGVDRLFASSLPMTPGSIEGGHHHRIPGPGPATLELVAAARAPVRPFGDGRELVTPTGAALVTTLASLEQPPMIVERVGYGAGQADLPWPNVLRLWLGSPVPGEVAPHATHVVLETSIDDMSPQLLAPVADMLAAAGALDVATSPLLMKKGRAGTLVTVIAEGDKENALAEILLRETTTLGVRVHPVRRHEAGRAFHTVDTPYGPVIVKLKVLDGRIAGAMPEFESARVVAGVAGVPLIRVHAAAAAAGQSLVGRKPEDTGG